MSATGKVRTLHGHPHAAGQALAPAALACMGVVFGDIGTSPLYTVSVTLKASSPGGTVAPEAVLGIVSLIFWSLIVVISIKYALLIMRADNHGEGGILALLALISPRRARQSRRRAVMVVIGLLGATLLYGDGAITPAISVLSAIEGLKVYAPQTERVIVPLTVAILVLLFVVQRKGTSFIGGIFGPVMLVWFIAIALLGIAGIAQAPAILAALSPFPAITYLWNAGPVAFAVIGGAFLAVTGGEALYADMGHFGRLPIRVAWFGCALPALTLASRRPLGAEAWRIKVVDAGLGEVATMALPALSPPFTSRYFPVSCAAGRYTSKLKLLRCLLNPSSRAAPASRHTRVGEEAV